jgi:CheY-like chemotaxis protein
MQRPTMKKILLADDDMLTRLSIAQTLLRDGYQVIHAEDGIKALEQMKKRRPDLIICNLEISKLGGHELHKAALENPRTRNIPIIFLTEETLLSVKQIGYENERIEYLSKPFTRDQLIRIVQRNLHRKRPA